MVGHLVRECERARRDARIGVRDHWTVSTPCLKQVIYFDAWRRETERMQASGQLPQLALALRFDPEPSAKSP